MANEFRLPELGENIAAGTVTKVLVAVGDAVAVDQPVLELETDKAVLEVPCSISGTVAAIHVKEGESVKVGAVVLTLSDGAPAKEEKAAEKPPKAEAKPKPVAQKPAEAPAAPVKAKPEAPAPQAAAAAPQPQRGARAAFAAPSVRRLAREIGVDINEVAPSGPDDRLSMEDVKSYARQMNVDVGGVAPRARAPETPLPDFERWGEVEPRPMSSVRRKTAEHLAYAWATVPHVTQFDKADVTELEKLRTRYGPRVEAAGGKLTVTAILLKILGHALQRFPQFNATLDLEKNAIVHKKYYNIGVAVDTDRGLLVPVIRDVQAKNVTELCVELAQVAERARSRKTTLDEMQGGTFTVTNLGGIGGTGFTPVVNTPEVAILGVARARIEPAYLDGQFLPRTLLPLALSYDHRVIDGADGARFLRWVVEALEQPFLLFLEG